MAARSSAQEECAQRGAALRQAARLNFLDLRQSHGAADGMAQEGAGVDGFAGGARPGGIHHIGPADAGREGKSAGEGFAQANHVGHDAAVLAGEPFAGAAKAGVNFVKYKQRAQLVAKFAQQGEKAGGRNVDAAAGLHRLGQNRAEGTDLVQFSDRALKAGQIGVVFRKRGEGGEPPQLRIEKERENGRDGWR